MDLAQLQKELEQTLPPIESWQPTLCGDIPITIKHGVWFYQESEISRPALIKLFAKVLVKEQNDYYLITPIEKMRIQVEGSPFVITAAKSHHTAQGEIFTVTDNIEREFILGAQFPLSLEQYHNQLIPTVTLPFACKARLNRNVYYQLAQHCFEQDGKYYLRSGDDLFLFAN